MRERDWKIEPSQPKITIIDLLSSDNESDFEINSPMKDLHELCVQQEKSKKHIYELSSDESSLGPSNNNPVENNQGPIFQLFSFQEFIQLWHRAERDMKNRTEDIENGPLVRKANHSAPSSTQSKAQYGRILPNGLQKIFKLTKLKQEDRFLDIGHGIGNAPLQAAYTIGCNSRGIEISKDRHFIAKLFEADLVELTSLKEKKHGLNYQRGITDLREGTFTDPSLLDFIQQCNVILVNNANGCFGPRCNHTVTQSLDDYLGAIFASMRPNTQMVTLDQIMRLGRDVHQENELRKKFDCFLPRPDASFFTCQTFDLGPNTTSWAPTKHLTVYLYTRVGQDPNFNDRKFEFLALGDNPSKFLCHNPDCWKNNNNEEAFSIVVEVGSDNVVRWNDECVYCKKRRLPITRSKRSSKKPVAMSST